MSGVAPEDLDALLRLASSGANNAVLDAMRAGREMTGAEMTRVGVRGAFELAIANGLITVVPRERWPDRVVISPPFTR